MTSACIFKETLRKDTQVFLNFKNSILEICLHLINSNFTSYFLLPTFTDADQRRGNIKQNLASEKWTRIIRDTDHSSIFIFWNQLLAW